MGKLITSLDDLISFFPAGSVHRNANEYDSPCPFCDESYGGAYVTHNEQRFYGTDRLSWFLNDNSFYCRKCHLHSGKYVYNLSDMVNLFELQLSPNFDFEQITTIQKRPIHFWSEYQILEAHYRVYDKTYWQRFGWNEEVIDTFHLGYAQVNQFYPFSYIIPMQIRTVTEPSDMNQFYLTYRIPGEHGSKRLAGTVRDYFWMYTDAPRDKEYLILTEGEKDGISAWVAGFKNFVASFGTNGWTVEKTRYLSSLGYRKFIICGDNDTSGKKFAETVWKWAEALGMDAYVLDFGEDAPEGFDLTDLLVEQGADTKDYILRNLYKPDLVPTLYNTERPAYVEDYRVYDESYTPETPVTVSLDELRDGGEYSIKYAMDKFMEDYDQLYKRGRGLIKVIKSSPGSGKTYASVDLVEEVAHKAIAVHNQRKQELLQAIDSFTEMLEETTDVEDRKVIKKRIENLQHKYDTYSIASVLWMSPYKRAWSDILGAGANPDMWYEFEARSRENCENYEYTVALGNNNHNIGQFCQTSCPLKEMCERSGYLSQERKRREKPITFFRHQTLLTEGMVDDYHSLVLIDENPLHIFEEPRVFDSEHIYAHNDGWQIETNDPLANQALEVLAECVRLAMNTNVGQPLRLPDGTDNPDYTLSGRAFISVVDAMVQNRYDGYTLSEVLKMIPKDLVHNIYQPNYIGKDLSEIKVRALPFIYDALVREVEDYETTNQNFNTGIHLVSGTLECYPMERIRIRAATPVILTDATADMEQLVSSMFKRSVDIYSPQIRNERTKTVVVRGSDWTISQLMYQLGKELQDRKKRYQDHVVTMTGDTFPLSDIPVNPDLYENNLIEDYRDVISAVLENHDSVFVVTHKKIVGVLDDLYKHAYPDSYEKLAFGHFSSLRGSNDYKHYDAVVLIGVPRMPYDIMWRRISAWARMCEYHEYVSNEMGYIAKPYHTRTDGHTYFTFENVFARQYADMYEEGEMVQCAERIRPHSSENGKSVYVFASRPAINFVDEVRTKTEFLNRYRLTSKHNRIKKFILDSIEKDGIVPSRRSLMQRFTCGATTVATVRKELEEELGMTLPRKRS